MVVKSFDYRGVALCAAINLLASGCATQDTAVQGSTTSGDAGATEVESPAAEVIPLGQTSINKTGETEMETALPDIAELAKEIASNPLSLWQSTKNSYEFFIGGVLNAQYSPNEKILTVMADSKEQGTKAALTCKYTLDNTLKAEVPAGSDIKDPTGVCDRLTRELARTLAGQ